MSIVIEIASIQVLEQRRAEIFAQVAESKKKVSKARLNELAKELIAIESRLLVLGQDVLTPAK